MDKILSIGASVAKQHEKNNNANKPRFSSAVIAKKNVRRGTHAITSDVDAVQSRNERAWNVLRPRLTAELSREITSDHVLSINITSLIAFIPRLVRV